MSPATTPEHETCRSRSACCSRLRRRSRRSSASSTSTAARSSRPPVDWRRPVRSSLALFRSRWYVIGIVVAMGSWGFHVGALALAPISLVQSVIAGGLVLLTVVADRLFGFTVTRREWIGVALDGRRARLPCRHPRRRGRLGAQRLRRPVTLAAYVGRRAPALGPGRGRGRPGDRARRRAARRRRPACSGAPRTSRSRRSATTSATTAPRPSSSIRSRW